jgi:Na+-driven multidrug efflux pump
LWRAIKLASVSLALTLGIATVVLIVFSPQVITIFSDDPELIAIAVPAMRITLSTLALVGPTILFITAFQGLSKGKEAMILSLLRQLVFFVPLLLLLSRIWGINGIWLSIPATDILGFIVAGLWLFREYKLQQQKCV